MGQELGAQRLHTRGGERISSLAEMDRSHCCTSSCAEGLWLCLPAVVRTRCAVTQRSHYVEKHHFQLIVGKITACKTQPCRHIIILPRFQMLAYVVRIQMESKPNILRYPLCSMYPYHAVRSVNSILVTINSFKCSVHESKVWYDADLIKRQCCDINRAGFWDLVQHRCRPACVARPPRQT